MTRYLAASPFEKRGTEGDFHIRRASNPPLTPFSKGGNNSVLKIVKRHNEK